MVWYRHDVWRQHPLISRGYKAAFPGLRLAVPAFAAFCVLESVYNLAAGDTGHHGPVNVTWQQDEIGALPEAIAVEGGHGHDAHHH